MANDRRLCEVCSEERILSLRYLFVPTNDDYDIETDVETSNIMIVEKRTVIIKTEVEVNYRDVITIPHVEFSVDRPIGIKKE